MDRLARIQLIGPLALFAAIGAAEAAALALAHAPSSSWLWYLNLDLFSVFRKSRLIIEDACGFPLAQLFAVAIPLAALTCIGLLIRRNIMVAIASNLSFVYVGFLIYSWHHWQRVGSVKSASLAWVQAPLTSHLYLFVVLLSFCFISFVATHVVYLRAARNGA